MCICDSAISLKVLSWSLGAVRFTWILVEPISISFHRTQGFRENLQRLVKLLDHGTIKTCHDGLDSISDKSCDRRQLTEQQIGRVRNQRLSQLCIEASASWIVDVEEVLGVHDTSSQIFEINANVSVDSVDVASQLETLWVCGVLDTDI